jgi:hypothetical protein
VSVFAGPVTKERVWPLIEKGEYVFTLLDLTFEEGGTYGDSLLWKWMLAERDTPTNYIARDDGNEKVIHEYTTPDVTIGSKPHEWIAALTGVVLEDGQNPPDSDELINKRMLAYLTHLAPKKGPNAGKLKERIAQGSAKPFKLPGQRSKPAPTQVSDDPDLADVDRALAVTKLQKKIARAVQLKTPSSSTWDAFTNQDFDSTDMPTLEKLLADATAEVNAALDD